MTTILDLHIHTTRYSGDSVLTPEDLLLHARRAGLHGVCLSEHEEAWPKDEFREFQRLAQGYGLLVVRAKEVSTGMGHIICLGLDEYPVGEVPADRLRRTLDDAGGVGILAHPFRYALEPDPIIWPPTNELGWPLPRSMEEAASHPIFGLVDAVEVCNGHNRHVENCLALAVAERLRLKAVGGTDAHRPQEVGRCVTVFEGDIRNEEDLIEAIRTGSFYPAKGPPSNGLARFDMVGCVMDYWDRRREIQQRP